MAKYSNGSVAKLDDAVTDADGNSRNYVGRVIGVNDNGETGYITVVSVGISNSLNNNTRLLPQGHINKRTQTFFLDNVDLAIYVEFGPTSSYKKIFDPVPIKADPPKINDIEKDKSFTAIPKDVSHKTRRKLVPV